ncbi:MAG: class I SAM-dependent methyltransferase [Chloroflexota bacterium]|nr:class I SAM-dependent methyltransferase [Chloroflexota bacterium]
MPTDIRKRFYEALDREYPARSNTYGNWNVPVMLLREIERLSRDRRILELGSGGGFLGAELHRLGFTRVTLTDFTATALASIREHAPNALLAGADASRLPFEDRSFDIVVSSDVIEHIPEVEQHISEVARVLALGGRYLLKTPNRPVAEAFYRLRGLHDAYFWHPSMFSPRELRHTFARHGFDVRLLAQPRLTDAQIVKLPGPRMLRSVAARVPLAMLPTTVRPHLEVVAQKR